MSAIRRVGGRVAGAQYRLLAASGCSLTSCYFTLTSSHTQRRRQKKNKKKRASYDLDVLDPGSMGAHLPSLGCSNRDARIIRV